MTSITTRRHFATVAIVASMIGIGVFVWMRTRPIAGLWRGKCDSRSTWIFLSRESNRLAGYSSLNGNNALQGYANGHRVAIAVVAGRDTTLAVGRVDHFGTLHIDHYLTGDTIACVLHRE